VRKLGYLRALVVFFVCLSMPFSAFAMKVRGQPVDITRSPRYASIVVNADTGDVLHKHDHNKVLHPASLTKMMTIYLTFQAIESKRLNLNKELYVSPRAAAQPRTNLNLKAGQRISVRDAIYGVIIHSANDAAVVLAEAISGTEDAFADRMTKTAHLLGMSNTYFVNSHGLHNADQVSTATDLAKLAIALRRDFPKYYGLFSKKSFIFRGTVITGHNRVLTKYRWADGLKTGFVNASGFNLASSATKAEGRLVAVVLGGPSASSRDMHMISLLEKGFGMMSPKKMTHFAHNPTDSLLPPEYDEVSYDEDAHASSSVFDLAESSDKSFNQIDGYVNNPAMAYATTKKNVRTTSISTKESVKKQAAKKKLKGKSTANIKSKDSKQKQRR
jgi:D-alanyl-D-alanine carboxypeptidase